jgi:DNA-binding Lrp family transcriptional regulator
MSLTRDNKGFIFRSGPVKQTNFSSFWDDNNDNSLVDSFLGLDEEKTRGKDVVALAGYKRAIGNFVSIVTEQNIPVTFNNNDESFTDGKKVVLGANLNDKNFDVAVGLALHEGSHIKLSDFNILKQLEHNIPHEVYKLADKVNVDKMTVIQTVKNILNYIEDRRIDSYIFRTSPGYKGYYHSMYDKYFYNKNVDKGLLSDEYRTEEIDSYMFRIINLHNKNRQLTALKGLKAISEEISLNDIMRGKHVIDTSMALNLACDVMSIILLNINPIVNNGEGGEGSSDSDEGSPSSDYESGSGNTPSENSGNDDGSESVELSDRQKSLLEKAFDKQKDFLNGNIKKTKLSKKDMNDVKAIEDSGATYENVGNGLWKDSWSSQVGKGTKCLVVKKLTQSLIDSNQFSCASKYNQEYYSGNKWSSKKYNFVEEGLRLGSILGKKLKVRGEESQIKYTRKDSGRLDKRLIAELGFGNSNVFSQTFVDKYNKAYLHISVDASGSMGGDKWNKAMTSAVAMIKACDMAGNIDVVVSIRATHYQGGGGHGSAMIMVCYDSRTDKLIKVKNLFPALDVSGTTPEGLCFEAIAKDLIPGNSNQDSYFINYSDGQPYYSNREINYSGTQAVNHTKKMVNDMKNKGLKVMSYFISEGDYNHGIDTFKTMYGKDASFINTTNMMDVAKTMNKKFLTK